MSTAGVGGKHGAESRGRGSGLFYPLALAGLLAVLSVAVVSRVELTGAIIFVTALMTFVVAHRTLLAWQSLLIMLVLVIMFVPIRRYTLPGDLPFELEPYRLALVFVIAGWLTSLLIDRRVRLAATGLEAPLALFGLAVLASIAANAGRISGLGATDSVLKTLTFFVSYFALLFMISSVAKSLSMIRVLAITLVLAGTCVAVLAVIESRTEFNPFNDLHKHIPFLDVTSIRGDQGRGARLRAYGPAQHPIALGAALTMLIPLALYLAIGLRRRWAWICTFALTAGALATVSRTSVVMLLTVALVLVWLRPKDFKSMVPLALPLLIAVHFALPGTLGSLKNSFFPAGGLIQEQRSSADSTTAAGRVADLAPSIAEFSNRPILGQGYGSRIVVGDRVNARLLDNQWLGLLLETGIVGILGFAWLVSRAFRRVALAAKSESGEEGWLLTAIAASVGSFVVGMFFFDAFAFIQVMFLFFIFLAFGMSLLRMLSGENGDAPRSGGHTGAPMSIG